MKALTARNIGIITGAAMIAFSLIIYKVEGSFESSLTYITYVMYVAGIVWTLLRFKKIAGETAGFKQFFAEGFKCFVLVTFLMVLFTLVFILMHPELKEQMATIMRSDLAKNKDFTPIDIEKSITNARKLFLPMFVMSAVFSYLAIGAAVTALGSVVLSRKQTAQ